MNFWKKIRFQFIEVVAYWESQIKARRLVNTFGISRMQATKDFKEYNNKYPNTIIHDDENKSYYMSNNNFPVCQKTPTINDYFLFLYMFEKPSWLFSFGCPGYNIRNINTNIVSKLLLAIQNNKAIQISYKALESAKDEMRVLKPIKIINTGFRWHVRALREKNGQYTYRDFLLSRFTNWYNTFNSNLPDIQDIDWDTKINVKLIINPKIKNREKRKIISDEFGLEKEELSIETNAALVKYVLEQYTIDIDSESCSYEKNLLTVKNIDEIRKYLLKPMDLSDERL